MKRKIEPSGTPAPLEISSGAYAVLVSTIISLRTRDAVTRTVSRRVLEAAPDLESMASMNLADLEELLRTAGFHRQKARQLRDSAAAILKDYGGMVPDSMEELLKLPGVGRKTANFVLGMVYGVPSICVDVHVHRISNRLGLADTATPEETEYRLRELFPPAEWTGINHIMVSFGQRICKPARPLCQKCPFSADCPSSTAHA